MSPELLLQAAYAVWHGRTTTSSPLPVLTMSFTCILGTKPAQQPSEGMMLLTLLSSPGAPMVITDSQATSQRNAVSRQQQHLLPCVTSALLCKLWLSCTVANSRSISYTVCTAVSKHGVHLFGYESRQLLLLLPLDLGYLSQAVLWPDMAKLTALAGPIPHRSALLYIYHVFVVLPAWRS